MRWDIKRLSVPILEGFLMIMSAIAVYAVELTFWHTGTEDEGDAIEAVAKDFTQKTGITVKTSVFSWPQSRTKFLSAIAAGVTPDIGTMGSTWPPFFGLKGGMVNLSKEFPEATKRIVDNTYPGAMRPCAYKGNVYGVRYDINIMLMFVRLDIFKELGLSVPGTWEEFTAVLSKLHSVGKSFAMGWGNTQWIGAFPYIWQAGGTIYTDGGKKSNLGSPESLKGLKFFTDFYKKYGAPYGSIDVLTGFITGEYPVIIDGDWIGTRVTIQSPELAGKWAVAPFPKGPAGNTGFIGGRGMGIFSGSKNKKEAMQFIEYIMSAEVQAKLFNMLVDKAGAVMLSANTKTWGMINLEPTLARVMKKQLENSLAPPFEIGGDESYRYLNFALEEVVLKGDDLTKAMKKADELTDKQMKLAREELGEK